MDIYTEDRLNRMEREMGAVRRQLRFHRLVLVLALAGFGLALAVGAAPGKKEDGHFDRVFARSITVANDAGKPAAKLYAADGGGSLMLRDAEDREAVHLIAGQSRNDLIIYDRRGDVALAAQGMADEGRLSLHKTYDDQATAEAAQPPDANIKSYLSKPGSTRVTIPVLRLPQAVR
jgi:hypothetical protein